MLYSTAHQQLGANAMLSPSCFFASFLPFFFFFFFSKANALATLQYTCPLRRRWRRLGRLSSVPASVAVQRPSWAGRGFFSLRTLTEALARHSDGRVERTWSLCFSLARFQWRRQRQNHPHQAPVVSSLARRWCHLDPLRAATCRRQGGCELLSLIFLFFRFLRRGCRGKATFC